MKTFLLALGARSTPRAAFRTRTGGPSLNVIRILSRPQLIVVALVALIALASLGCSKGGSAGGKVKVAFVTNNAADFWTIARRGCEQAARELSNVELDFRIPSDGTAAEQRRIVDDLMAAGISGMAISPVDPSNQTQMINALA